jgi:molybdopterin molybdotransferase
LSDLLNVDDALSRILVSVQPLAAEVVPLSETLGRVVAEDLYADASFPPFANSSMDGYAVRAEDVAQAQESNPRFLMVIMDIPAGFAPDHPIAAGQAARIMTGAPLPQGADAVVPLENTDAKWSKDDKASLSERVAIFKSVPPNENVRPIGEDIRAGSIVLSAGTLVRPAEMGVLAMLGRASARVIRRPRVAILGTGNELVGVDQPLAPGKIHDSNSYTLMGLVAELGAIPLRLPIARDMLSEVRALFRAALAQNPDMIISSAGVSVGAADLVRTVLNEMGKVDFWRINLRPGKPLAFGELQGIPFFGLPGNPVSAMVTFDVLVRPALLKMAGKPNQTPIQHAILDEDLRSDGRRAYLRVRLARENGQLVARTTGTQSSGALTSMVLADGLLIVPEDVTEVKAGTSLQVRLLRNID